MTHENPHHGSAWRAPELIGLDQELARPGSADTADIAERRLDGAHHAVQAVDTALAIERAQPASRGREHAAIEQPMQRSDLLDRDEREGHRNGSGVRATARPRGDRSLAQVSNYGRRGPRPGAAKSSQNP